MEEEKMIEKIDKFLDNEGLDAQGKFILTKKLSDEYWEEVINEGTEEAEEQEEEDPLGAEEVEIPEPTEEEIEEGDVPPVPPPTKRISKLKGKKKSLLKKPKLDLL